MITYTKDNIEEEFAAHILKFYYFKYQGIHKGNILCIDSQIVFEPGSFDGPSFSIKLEGRTVCEAVYDAAMAWQGPGYINWKVYPGFIPFYPDRPDPIQYMGSNWPELVQGQEIHDALVAGRNWEHYLNVYKFTCMETFII